MGYYKIFPESFITGMFNDNNAGINKEKLIKLLTLFMRDDKCDQHIKQMDKAGIDHSVLLIVDGEYGLGKPELDIEDIYKLHYEVTLRHKNRLSVFCGIDPRRGKKGLELVKKGIEKFGFEGLKLYPPMGFNIDDENLYPFIEICRSYKLPVLYHTGSSLNSLNTEYANPEQIIKIAEKFPEVNFILAHAGYRIQNEGIRNISKIDNVYLDISGFHAIQDFQLELTANNFDDIFSDEFNTKILFGTDWPLFNLLNPLSNPVNMLKKAAGNNLSALDNILYKNALKILKR